MNTATSVRARPNRAARFLHVTAIVLKHLVLALCVVWASLALYYSDLLPMRARSIGALAFAGFGIWALWISRRRGARLVFAAAFAIVLGSWLSLRPSNDREWRADVAVVPRAFIDGDRVRITGVRNFEYRELDDFTPRYEAREVEISHLTGVDFYISYWVPGPVAHTFISFLFDDAPPLSISIEARPEAHEGFSPLGSLFKELELIYVVGNERDIVRVRTNFRDEDVFLYRIRTSPEVARELFRVYLDRINELADRPEFYHLLSNSCTINIVRYAGVAGGSPLQFDIRHYFNGWSDRFLYRTGRLVASGPFEQIREEAHINALAQAANKDPKFSERIRAALRLEAELKAPQGRGSGVD